MSDLHEETLEAATGLITSQLRYHIAKSWAEKVGNADQMGSLWKVERGFVTVHREVWKEVLSSRWNLATGNPPELLDLIAKAADAAIGKLTSHFASLPPDWLSGQFDKWRETFEADKFIAEGV